LPSLSISGFVGVATVGKALEFVGGGESCK
jgi:hypothetical protein